jgi:hypothetical protein
MRQGDELCGKRHSNSLSLRGSAEEQLRAPAMPCKTFSPAVGPDSNREPAHDPRPC